MGRRAKPSSGCEAGCDRQGAVQSRGAAPCSGTPAPREARALALAYAIEAALEDGRFRSAAKIAGTLGLTRARLSQGAPGVGWSGLGWKCRA